MKTLTTLTVILLLFLTRFLHWLAIFQQKEYRFDRLKAFFNTPEGKKEVRRMLANRHHLHPKKWKRPAMTPRIFLIALSSAILMVAPLILILSSGSTWQVKIIRTLLVVVLEYIFIPLIIGAAAALSSVPAKLKTENELKKAKKKLAASNPLIIGIGGSYGKTSTKYLIHAILSQKYSVFKTPKSFNTPFSIAKSINQNYQGEKIVLLEYGAYQKGEIKSLTKWFWPEHAVITGFTEQHLHLFGSVEASQKAESELVAAIIAHGQGKNGKVWYNADDLRVEKILEYAGVSDASVTSAAEKIPYSANQIHDAHLDNHGFLVLNFANKNPTKTKLVGDHYLTNLAGALLVAKFLELNDEEIEKGITAFEPDERFVRSYPGKNIWILDDGGTSNPKGFEQIIKIAAAFKNQPKALLTSGIVDLGDQSEQIHARLAELATEVFDQIFYVGDSGKSLFKKAIPQKMVTNPDEITKKLAILTSDSLLVIEGRIPGWLRPVLKNSGVKV